jgi:NADH-quinone oxidoreductase subunit C
MTQEAAPTPAAPVFGPVAQLFQRVLPGVAFEASQTPIDEAITVQRDDFRAVMEAAKNHPDLAFDFLRCVSGVDWLTELESVYMLRSHRHGYGVLIKVRCPYEDSHVPTVSHLWASANWLERETHEMFGIVYDGHPDLRPLLTEEGLGYYILRKSHPLAEIEEWQEDYLQTIEEAKAQAASAGGAAPVVDEKAAKIAAAQAKAAIITKTRADARAKGLSAEDEKAAVTAALAKWDEEQAAQAAAAPAGGGAATDPKAAKIQMAQAKAKVITKARGEARAKGMSAEEERLFVAEALKKFSDEQGAPAPAAAPAAAAPQTQASKIQLAQAKAKIITKTREEARAKGLSPEEERAAVAEALKNFAQEQGG